MLAGYILSNKYEIVQLVKSMDFITIYKAIDLLTGMNVIIKELTDTFPGPMIKQQGLIYFQTEAKRYFKMNHKGLPKYIDYLDYGTKRYLILEQENGHTLRDFIEGSKRFIDIKQALRWSLSICKVLNFLSNIKPEPLVYKNLNHENILIMPDAEIKLFDFFSPTDRNLPNPFVLPPTSFSSPEHYGGNLDCRADIYSLGAIMFYILTREEPPFAFMLEDDPLPYIRDFNSNVSQQLDLVVRTAMAFNKEDRYEYAGDMELVLMTLMSERSFPRIESCGAQVREIPGKPEVKPPSDYRKRPFERKDEFLENLSREEISRKNDLEELKKRDDTHTAPRRRLKLLPPVKVRAQQGSHSDKMRHSLRHKPFSADRLRDRIDQPSSQEITSPPEDILSKYPELKNRDLRKKRENIPKRGTHIDRLPSGIKVLREKRRMAEEKLEAATDKLKQEIVFSGSLNTEKPNLKELLTEMKKKKDHKRTGSGENGPIPVSKTSRLSGITSRLADGSQPLETKGAAPFEGLTEEGLPPNFILNGRYKILDLINISSLSIAYKALDIITEKYAMIKQLKDSSADLATRHQALIQFKTEVKILFKVVHLNLPRYVDYFDYKYKRYLVTEYIYGKNFNQILRESPGFLKEVDVAKWGIQICEALSYLHNTRPEPIIFRNLKPENLILSDDGIVKMVDFGISKFFEHSKHTLEIAKIINRNFSPFEQYNGQTDNRTDLYSLGAFLYFLATGRKPADALDINLGMEQLRPCRRINPHLSPEFEKLIFKALSEDKEDRYQSAEEMQEALIEILKRMP